MRETERKIQSKRERGVKVKEMHGQKEREREREVVRRSKGKRVVVNGIEQEWSEDERRKRRHIIEAVKGVNI